MIKFNDVLYSLMNASIQRSLNFTHRLLIREDVSEPKAETQSFLTNMSLQYPFVLTSTTHRGLDSRRLLLNAPTARLYQARLMASRSVPKANPMSLFRFDYTDGRTKKGQVNAANERHLLIDRRASKYIASTEWQWNMFDHLNQKLHIFDVAYEKRTKMSLGRRTIRQSHHNCSFRINTIRCEIECLGKW